VVVVAAVPGTVLDEADALLVDVATVVDDVEECSGGSA